MRLLIVGALEGYITQASKIALEKGAQVTHALTIDQALHHLRTGKGADAVMVDIVADIGLFITQLRNERITVPVIACGITQDPHRPAQAIQSGAIEYIPLPPDPDMIAAILEAASAEERVFLTKDPVMHDLFEMVNRIAPSTASVLITGASGTGKEVMARYIHAHSSRSKQPFVSVNCAAIPENLLESELFGHEKGAFTGAIARRVGKFEEANGGTLLLDEISEMDPRLQAKLLRAIQEREIDRVGGNKPVRVDIRLLATSNRDLETEVAAQRFREDLFFRLNVVSVQIPCLAQRPLDIIALAEHFNAKYSHDNGYPVRPFMPEALEKLRSYGWPGNVRELENTIHRATLLAGPTHINPESITSPASRNAAPVANEPGFVGRSVADVEKQLIMGTLSHCAGNRTHAAKILGISIRTLRNKLNLYKDDHMPLPQRVQNY